MVYKIFFISTIFSLVIVQLGYAIPSESAVAKSQKRDARGENINKTPNEKDSEEMSRYTHIDKRMWSETNTSLHDKDSPTIYFNINKFNIRQYKDSNVEKMEKEIMFDTFAIKDNLSKNSTLDKLRTNAIMSDPKQDERMKIHQETIGNFTKRLLPNILDKPLTSDKIKNGLTNNTQQLPALSPNNNSTNCTSDINEESYEKDSRRMFDTKNITNNKQGQDLDDSDVTKHRYAVTNHARLCYVCNSIYDPSCWSPGRGTAVKYCREQHQFCLTHHYIHNDANYVVRECGNTCISTTFDKSSETFASCTVCYTDLCNNACYLKAQNIVFLLLILFTLIKN